MLDIFEFRAAPSAEVLLQVIDILRAMNRDKVALFLKTRRWSGLNSAGGHMLSRTTR